MRYRRIAKEIYCWVMAILCVGLVCLGWYMVGLTFYDRWYHDSLMLHKSFGMVVLLLVLAKGGWTLYAGVERSSSPEKPLNRKYTHITFYLLMAVITVSGYFISTSAGAPISMFGLFGMPAIVAVSDAVRDVAIGVHYYLSYGTVFLAMLHGVVRLKPRVMARR
ncbi:MAG: cytochrome b [Thermodesulfobacteriota bacterium]